jgi:undecaprenyl-diphosphatase
LIGFVVAFLAAVVAVRWLVSYLSRHGLELFGWYRIVVAAIAIVLVITGTI